MVSGDASSSISSEASSDGASAAAKFVPIRPAFRPLLPKPSSASGSEPTVVLKSHSRSAPKLVKKRKSDTGPLANTVAPSSLVSKRRKSPPATSLVEHHHPRRRNTSDSRSDDDDLSSKEGSVSPAESKGLVSPPLTASLSSSTLSLSMLSNNDDPDGPLYSLAAAKVSLSGLSKGKPVLVPASPPSLEQSDIKNADILLSSTTTLDAFMEPLHDLALETAQQSSLASPTEQFDALEGINFDDLDVGAFLAADQTSDGDANGFDPMEIFGPRLDIF